MTRLGCGAGLLALMMGCTWADAQSLTNMAALKGLAPVSALSNSAAGKAALASNFTVTGGIQTGVIRQPTLSPFAEQQQQALRDAFITDGNLAQLADGLGTTLGAAYQARAHYLDRERFTNISKAVAEVIAYANSTSGSDSNAGKYFFANGTTDGKKPVSDEALAIFKTIDGAPDPFGVAYGRPAGTPGADVYGDSRPFQTEPTTAPIVGLDYFNVPASNEVYNRGPIMNLINSPSFPSGHTTYGYMGSLLLAVLVPDRYQEMVVRAAEYGNDRIIMGAHYAMDVLGGRTVATYDLAHLLANDPAYIGRPLKDFARATAMSTPQVPATIEDFRAAVANGAGRPDQGAGGGLRRYGRRLRASGHRPLQRAGDERGLLRNHADLRPAGHASGDGGQGGGCGHARARSRIPADCGFPETQPRGGEPNPDRDGRAWRRLSRRRIGLWRLFPAQPFRRRRPRGGDVKQQALRAKGFKLQS